MVTLDYETTKSFLNSAKCKNLNKKLLIEIDIKYEGGTEGV